jgi:AraC-like DNA-binding protein
MQRSLMSREIRGPGSAQTPAGSSAGSRPGAPGAADSRNLVAALRQSRFYQEYGAAFTKMTGLSLNLIPADSPHSRADAPTHLPFASDRRSQADLTVRWKLAAGAPVTDPAPPELSDPCFTIVPISIKNRVVGYLRTGLMVGEKPTAKQFDRFFRHAAGSSPSVDPVQLKKAFFSAAILTGKTHESALKLLSFLAQHLGMLSIQVFIPPNIAEPSCINRARAYIQEHQSEKIYLAHVASVVNLNTFYFCKIFRRITGLNFTDYVARVRIEKSKLLLANAELAVGDIALASGFQTVTHFNRVFKKLTGFSPTAFRNQAGCP